jgi:hypothetical protein
MSARDPAACFAQCFTQRLTRIYARAQRWRGVGSTVASAPSTPATSRCSSPAFGAPMPATPLSLPAQLHSRLPPSGKTQAAFGMLPQRTGLGDMSNLWRR